MLQRLNVKILLLNPWIWWLIFTVIFLSQITIVYADDYLPIVSDSPGPLYDERDYLYLYKESDSDKVNDSTKSSTNSSENESVDALRIVQSEFTDKSYEDYKTSMNILLEISLSPKFENYQKPIQDMITRALLGISIPPTWVNANIEVTCLEFSNLLGKYDNNPLIRTLYMEYLLSNIIDTNLSPEDLAEYYKSPEFSNMSETVWNKLLELFPSKD
jgi:hypothetical protein